MLTMNVDVNGLKLKDFKDIVETKTPSIVIGLYYFSKGLNIIKRNANVSIFVEKWQSNEGSIQLYVSHKNEDLGDYIGHKNEDLGDYILVELKPYCDLGDSNDEFSDVA